MTNDLTIEAREISLRYGNRAALDSFSLDVPSGSVFGLLGPNGSGKTSFLTLVASMEQPAEGSLAVFGQAPAASLRARLGVVFQENTIDPTMRVGEALRLCARLFGADASRIPTLLERFGLAQRRDDRVATLSGGMRRRLEAVRALVHDPDLLLLDEPTTGVDPDERRALWDTILGDRPGRTILLATNDLSEADAVCNRVAFVRLGQVVAAGTPDELKRGLKAESVRLEWPTLTDGQIEEIAGWPGVGSLSREADGLLASVDDASEFVPRLFQLAPHQIRSVRVVASSLEDAYFHHVGERRRELAEVVV